MLCCIGPSERTALLRRAAATRATARSLVCASAVVLLSLFGLGIGRGQFFQPRMERIAAARAHREAAANGAAPQEVKSANGMWTATLELRRGLPLLALS